jgi:hypothetical protein
MAEKIFTELQERREKQLSGLRMAFELSFREYASKSGGKYPDLKTDKDVDSYIGARRELWNSIQRLDMVLKDVTRIALEVLNKNGAEDKEE